MLILPFDHRRRVLKSTSRLSKSEQCRKHGIYKNMAFMFVPGVNLRHYSRFTQIFCLFHLLLFFFSSVKRKLQWVSWFIHLVCYRGTALIDSTIFPPQPRVKTFFCAISTFCFEIQSFLSLIFFYAQIENAHKTGGWECIDRPINMFAISIISVEATQAYRALLLQNCQELINLPLPVLL